MQGSRLVRPHLQDHTQHPHTPPTKIPQLPPHWIPVLAAPSCRGNRGEALEQQGRPRSLPTRVTGMMKGGGAAPSPAGRRRGPAAPTCTPAVSLWGARAAPAAPRPHGGRSRRLHGGRSTSGSGRARSEPSPPQAVPPPPPSDGVIPPGRDAVPPQRTSG